MGRRLRERNFGADDYLKVLRTLQNHEEAVEAKLREEMPRAEGAQ